MVSKEEEVEVLLKSILNGDDTPVQKENTVAVLRAILEGEDSPKRTLTFSPFLQNNGDNKVDDDDDDDDEVVALDLASSESSSRTDLSSNNASRKLDFPSSSSSNTSSSKRRSIPLKRKRRSEASREHQKCHIEYQTFKNQKHSLYLSASQIAAMIGLHPYNILPKLCMDLVYQGRKGRALLRHDAQLLQISLVDEDESLRQIATKGGAGIKKALEQAINIGKGKENVSSIEYASKIKDTIVSKVKESKKLTFGEMKLLIDGMRHNVNTGFGTAHEENALDVYEKQIGWEITERNAERRTWKFVRAEDANDEFKQGDSKTVVPLDDSVVKKLQNEVKKATVNSKDDIQPYFSINGRIDGIRDEMYHVPSIPTVQDGTGVTCHELHPQHMELKYSDDNEWALRRVVIECKHRMNKAFNPPPIYDQIQAITYAFMYDTSEAELVQVVRNEESITETNQYNIKKDATQQTNKESDKQSLSTKERQMHSSSVTITSSRISLDDPIMKHRENWYATVLPRLRSFVDAVYSIRSDDDKRYRLLRAAAMASSGGDDKEWWHILHNECPFLKHCDTAFYGQRKRY